MKLREILEELIRKNYRQAFQKPVYSYYDVDQAEAEILQNFKDRVSVERIAEMILKYKYPNGLPFLPNVTGGYGLGNVYPEEYKLATELSNQLGGD